MMGIDRLPGNAQEKMTKQLVGKMLNGEAGDILTGLIAAKEISMLRAVADLHDEMGIEHIEQIPEKEERKEQMKALVEALISGDIPGFWFEQIGQENLENADAARDYLDLEADEWRQKCDLLVKQYRKQGDERPRSEIVTDYINRQFGVSVGWFVSHVVVWNRDMNRNVAQMFLLGNFNGVEQGIRIAAEGIRQHNEQARLEDLGADTNALEDGAESDEDDEEGDAAAK